eukprot:CAMPEP_0175124276 /NCGR_PEP_ID=MMETSP0087-20121206/2694_1 /TAXON_ID=136419 /ORGANISM="Unknown Unknown, Strain D1" /LENGTH=172 /DNA_ID=CAMNT_0016406031 /DNA_START=60 /DNA_END=575 /DNA_ORIENTATION=+
MKIVVVGDGAVGKTNLCSVGTLGTWPMQGMSSGTGSSFTYTTDHNHAPNGSKGFDDREHTVHDTNGQEDYDRIRPLVYPGADVFVVCFAVDRPASLANLSSRWVPEVRAFCKSVPFILVGCKTDTRQNHSSSSGGGGGGGGADQDSTVSAQQGQQWAQQLGASAYVECSAKA